MAIPTKSMTLKSLALQFALGAGAAQAGALDPTLSVFLAKFADMARRGAADSMADVTRFPLKNAVYQEPTAISRAGFKHHFQLNSYPTLAGCLKTKRPERAASGNAGLGEWVVDCDGNAFYFANVGGQWRHSGFENVNE